jgi:hypothetical protein
MPGARPVRRVRRQLVYAIRRAQRPKIVIEPAAREGPYRFPGAISLFYFQRAVPRNRHVDGFTENVQIKL